MSWSLVNLLSRMLEVNEREAVLGDLAESGESGARAVLSLAGLVARRQAALWRVWRPWAALCLAIPAGCYFGWYLGRAVIGELRGLDLWIVVNRKDLDPALLAEYGMNVRHAMVALARGGLLLAGSAGVIGVALGWLARRALWAPTALFAVLVGVYPLPRVLQDGHFWMFLRLVLVVLLPAALGMRLGRRKAAT